MVSFWNRDKKDNPNKPTYVSITLSNGTDIKRERSNGFNGYYIGDAKLEAIGQGIPQEIETAFNITDVNVQYQFDQPFLLSNSAADVARFFNKTIRLDLIDKVQSKAEALRRKTNQEISASEELSNQLYSQIQDLDWIDIAESLVTKVEVIEKRILESKTTVKTCTMLRDSYIQATENQQQSEFIYAHIVSVQEIDIIIEKINDNKTILESLIKSTIDVQKYSEIISNQESISSYENLVQQIDSIQEMIEVKAKRRINLLRLFNEYSETLAIIHEEEQTIQELQSLLPSTCPVCGNSIEKDHTHA